MKAFYLFLFLAGLLSSCKKDYPDTKIWMSFTETQCANPFKVEKDVNNTQKNIEKYLSDSGLYVYDMKYEYYGPGYVCMACFCPKSNGGYTHYIKIDSTERKKAENLCFGKR